MISEADRIESAIPCRNVVINHALWLKPAADSSLPHSHHARITRSVRLRVHAPHWPRLISFCRETLLIVELTAPSRSRLGNKSRDINDPLPSRTRQQAVLVI